MRKGGSRMIETECFLCGAVVHLTNDELDTGVECPHCETLINVCGTKTAEKEEEEYRKNNRKRKHGNVKAGFFLPVISNKPS